MSFAQRSLRTRSLHKQYVNSIKACPASMKQLRDLLFSFSNLDLPIHNRQYLDGRWDVLERLLMCESGAEIAMNLSLMKCSATLNELDFIAFVFGYFQTIGDKYRFKPAAIVDLMTNFSEFETMFKNTRFLRLLVKCTTRMSLGLSKKQKDYFRKILACICKKHRDLLGLNFMFGRDKCGGLFRRISDQQIEKWLLIDIDRELD